MEVERPDADHGGAGHRRAVREARHRRKPQSLELGNGRRRRREKERGRSPPSWSASRGLAGRCYRCWERKQLLLRRC
ncbi:unnamed protein product [Urochloa humidicola]